MTDARGLPAPPNEANRTRERPRAQSGAFGEAMSATSRSATKPSYRLNRLPRLGLGACRHGTAPGGGSRGAAAPRCELAPLSTRTAWTTYSIPEAIPATQASPGESELEGN